MSGAQITLLVLGILGGVGLIYAVVLFKLRKLRDVRVEEARQALDSAIVHLEPAANSFGQTSLGMAQVRGVGVLAFTEREVFFLMWLPKREFRIPVASITAIETPRSHLGKSRGRPLLKVVFAGEGGEDSIAWQVKDLEQTKAELEKLCGRSSLA